MIRPVLGMRALLALLLLPPVLHAAAFPAGTVLHDYWLFGLPPALAAAAALLALRLRPVVAALALGLLLLPGVVGAREILARRDDLPETVGRVLAARTAPGDLVLTNFNCSPRVPGGAGDEHVDKVLEVRGPPTAACEGWWGRPMASGWTRPCGACPGRAGSC